MLWESRGDPRSIYAIYTCYVECARTVVARATMYLYVHATNLYRHASTGVYRVNRHERETPADGRFESFSTYLPFTSLSYLYVDRGSPPAIQVIMKLQNCTFCYDIN